MLIKATLDDIEKYGEFVYSIALDQSRSSYPTYADGITEKEEFYEGAKRSVERDNYDLLLYVSEGVMEGWVSYFWIEEDNYLQLFSCNINSGTKQALGELLMLLEERFPGYEINFGFSKKNTEAVEFLQENGYECIEEDHDTNLDFRNYELKEENGNVVEVTRDNFKDFQSIHALTEADMYWTSDRIFADLETWKIFIYYEKNQPVGTLFCNWGSDETYLEIYGVEFMDGVYKKDVFMALMTAILNAGKRKGAKYLTFFCEEELKAVQELGFTYVGPYVCYRKEI